MMENNNKFNRRRFLKNSLLAAGGIFIAPLIESCSDDFTGDTDTAPDGLKNAGFETGVASFDPGATNVIIWTRYSAGVDAELTWEISKNNTFSEVIRRGKANATIVNDFTVAVDIQNISSNTKFYYRFYNVKTKETSVVGETLTLPSKTDSVNEVKMAVVSCSNFPAGLFNVYGAIAQSDADVVVHLGDYIYEYAPGQYGTNPYTNQLGRAHQPAREILNLSDYRERYRQYRGDKNLQFLHQKKPFICVWDDHEFANDTYKSGAENHQPDEGDFQVRKMAAFQAYSEYIPLKTGKDLKIYRSFNFGNIVSLYMMDTRVIARDKQLEYSDYLDSAGNFNQVQFKADFLSTGRKLIGNEQMTWLGSQINADTAKWKVLGQQILMTKMMVPAELLMLLNQILAEIKKLGSAQPATMLALQNTITQLIIIKTRHKQQDPTLTPQEIARVTTTLPYNLDAWDGYFMEREQLYSILAGKNVIVLAGDTHNAWLGKLTNVQGTFIGTELACSSVSSPGLEGYLGITSDPAKAIELAQAFTLLIDDLDYANLYKRGYLHVKFTTGSSQAEWRFVDNIVSETYNTSTEKTYTIS
ncbi:alkaline phosphatase [Chryseobacterium lactis]|uniref:Alkaline phosphatase n=1 Tax=Chryseobacterium lactis TaxID=1241981 RepID=A0A3G6REU9_CHRLC|nr:alkaline phosphatase D family protein [Chryseobacterium lactis]AZA82256.1 alkaline phosphatase [Chryseobacterium lactis]AZB02638.1 alkaline phosphatase [Chryseobacterium lactis]PNW14069.1 alkaline phosphatase [Chryseobacterium lactis]